MSERKNSKHARHSLQGCKEDTVDKKCLFWVFAHNYAFELAWMSVVKIALMSFTFFWCLLSYHQDLRLKFTVFGFTTVLSAINIGL